MHHGQWSENGSARRLAVCVAGFISHSRCSSVLSVVLRYRSSSASRWCEGLETGFLGAAQSRAINDLRSTSSQLPRLVINSVYVYLRTSNYDL